MINGNGVFHDVFPAEIYEKAIPMPGIDPGLQPGRYKLKARTVLFPRTQGKPDLQHPIELLSNVLEVEVK
jgi:hypothetical protein